MRFRADLVLLVVAVLWGSAFAAQRTAALWGSVYVFNGARFLVAAVLLLPFAARRPLRRGQLAWMLAAGVILFTASALQQAGLKTTTASNAGFLTSLYVVLVPLVLLIGWGEKPGALALAAVTLAALGAYMLSAAGAFHVQHGDLLEIAGAAFWAIHVVLLGKYASRYDALAFSMGQMLVASALNWMVSGFLEPLVLPLPPDLIRAILYTAIVSLGLGYTLQVWGQRHTPPTDAALILSMEAVFAALAGYLILGERLTPIQLLGCTVIVLAVALSQLGAWGRIATPKKVQARRGPT
jgi:drug/metabolite transporter (DMT)-like permease